ncbi:hypothetical protein [Sphingomonas yabuuchiae]|uniref:Uncharacterized protein n=1 Tax=Sphingomonas yabuuchiae TaxID=172044 RepID=A0AA40ZYP2_9SPHN|nr:hypothetical protein [Sphingomonas yabuuchiae]MBB4611509.1 hypothetical protein [Sphingomonas yabuuchiae]MBN3556951.1 hypothetical protein [Sphingomonas yabuuchiae]
MAQPSRTTTAGGAGRAAAASPRGEQRRHPADDLESVRDRLEALIRRVRHGARSHADFHDQETEAHRIARDLVKPFRGPDARPVNPPLWVSPDGRSAGW